MAKNFLKLKRYQIIVLGSSENIKQNNAHRYVYLQGFPGSSGIKNPPVMQEMGFSSWVGKIPLRRNGSPLQYSCLGNPMDRGAWQATVLGIARVRHDLATKQQQTHLFTLQKTNVMVKTLKAREKLTLPKRKHYNGPPIYQ